MVIFQDFYFRENRPEKCVLNHKKVFYDILDDGNALIDYKNKRLRKSENWDFFFFHGFGQKLVIFPDFNFWINRPEKCVLRCSKRKKRLSRLYKPEV